MEDQSQGGRSHLITNEPFHRSSSDPDRHLPSTLSTLPTKSGSRAASRTLPPSVSTRARCLSACVCLSSCACLFFSSFYQHSTTVQALAFRLNCWLLLSPSDGSACFWC